MLSVNSYAAVNNIAEEDGSPSVYPWKIKVTNGTLTNNGDGTVSLSTGGGGSGDSVQVNSSDTDTIANFVDGDIVWALSDGGAGGPDAITGTFLADSIDDTHINWGSGAGQVDYSDIPSGNIGTTGTITLRQAADNAEMIIYGYDDLAAVGLYAFIHESGAAVIHSETGYYLSLYSGGAGTDIQLQSGGGGGIECFYDTTGNEAFTIYGYDNGAAATKSGGFAIVNADGAFSISNTAGEDIQIDGGNNLRIYDHTYIKGDFANLGASQSNIQLSLRQATTSTKEIAIGYPSDLDYGVIQVRDFGNAWKDLYLQPLGGNVNLSAANLVTTGTLGAGATTVTTINTGSGAMDLGDAAVANGDTNSIPTGDQVYDFVVGGWVASAGVFDFGGATSVEIPNGTSGTTDATGEIYYDTNGDNSTVIDGVIQLYTGAANQYFFGIAGFPSSDNDVMAFDSATNKVTWQAQAGGAGGGATYREITLLPESCVLDDTVPPAISVVESTGTGTPRFRVADFDADADEIIYYTFVMPSDYTASSSPIVDIYWFTNDTTADETCVWGVQLSATTAADADAMTECAMDADIAYVSTDIDTNEANRLIKSSVTLTYATYMDSAAAGDIITIAIRRDADSTGGTDDLTSDARLVAIHLKIPRS